MRSFFIRMLSMYVTNNAWIEIWIQNISNVLCSNLMLLCQTVYRKVIENTFDIMERTFQLFCSLFILHILGKQVHTYVSLEYDTTMKHLI